MEKNRTYGVPLENDSYVRGASQVGAFEDDSISSFHPLAVSTSTKSGHDLDGKTYCQPNRFRLSLSSLITSDDDQENRGDTSSLGLLSSDPFKSESSIAKFPQASGDENRFFDWDISGGRQQEGVPDFSAEFGGKEIHNNLDFIEKEEARNKADHPFIQEEVMGDTNAHYDTSSWSVSRALETADDRPTSALHTSSQSNVSVSSFFKRRSASLGHFNGSALPSDERPSFGLTVVERKLLRHQSTSPVGASVSLGHNNRSDGLLPAKPACLDAVLNAAAEKSAFRDGKKALSDSIVTVSNVDRSNHHRDRKHSDEQKATPLAAKPPRGPLKSQFTSPSCAESIKEDVSVIGEKTIFNMTDSNNSFLSLTAIQMLVNDVSVSGSASMLAKEIISKSEIVKRPSKKRGEKEEKPSATTSGTASSVASKNESVNVDVPPISTKVQKATATTEMKSRPLKTNIQSNLPKVDCREKPFIIDLPPAKKPIAVDLPPAKPEIVEIKGPQPKPTSVDVKLSDNYVVEKENKSESAASNRGSALEEQESKTGVAPADSIVVEMRVGGILYKGVLYAQFNTPDSGRSSS